MALLPPIFHPTIAYAAIAHKSFNVELSPEGLPSLIALAALPASPPSIEEINVANGFQLRSRATQSEPAACVIKALHHHSTISALNHEPGALYNNAMLSDLGQAISSLPFLHTLHLGSASSPFPVATFPVLQLTLSSTPQLQKLTLYLAIRAVIPQPRKRLRSEQRAALPLPVTSILAPATSLTSLHLYLNPLPSATTGMRPTRLTLPHLAHLALTTENCNWAAALLGALAAPQLSRVRLNQPDKFTAMHDRKGNKNCANALSKFKRLTSLSIPPGSRGSWPGSVLCMMLDSRFASQAV